VSSITKSIVVRICCEGAHAARASSHSHVKEYLAGFQLRVVDMRLSVACHAYPTLHDTRNCVLIPQRYYGACSS
jgi:hypothetical protein